MNRLPVLPLIILATLILGAGCLEEQGVVPATPPTGHAAMLLLLDDAAGKIQDALNGLDQATAGAAGALETPGISGPVADTELGRIVASQPVVQDVITYNQDAVVLAAEPEAAKVLIGRVLDVQPTLQAVSEKPLMSALFPLERGRDGVAIVHPVFSAEGTFVGVVSTAFSPYELVAPIVLNVSQGTPYSFMVVQTGGRVLYDPDPEEVGRETFDETMYAEFPEIIAFARQYAGNRTGYGTYSFHSTGFGEIVRKEAFWTTVGLHGTEWRVMVIREV
jgi:polar amino acid transport system substrate-binding protein